MTILCRLDELEDPGSKGFEFGSGSSLRRFFIVRRGEKVFGYVNRCPHAGSTLDWSEDAFLDMTRNFIICATHGALFTIEQGRCMAGPCRNRQLEPVPVEVVDGMVRLVPV